MSDAVLIALLSLLGTLLGSAGGVFASSRLTNYRIGELEKKVDRHNTIVERTALIEKEQKTMWKRIDENAAGIARAARRGGI